ncbi:uncharacterized protein FFB20_11669 [Fusarium fujikuroi]|nr:uncharacterized protein Y057_5635 [Fusarium fujikuroi]SCN71886.1 uncharacterized protein FFE2_02410 [Fusarium fujikuroi]SCO02697.1 uncharacterized protein FFB20_11669 [Fusarium fujikuroi]SCO03222.1 uncharacterized protein FFC1_09244 [Fusarium fujikuroi]
MTTTRDYKWHQVKPGVWQRHIDGIEQFYSTMVALYEGSGRMFFGMTGHVSLSIKHTKGSSHNADLEVDKALRKAWLALRCAHPTLASQVTQDVKSAEWIKTYRELQGDTDKEAWLERTLVHVSNGQTGNQWANSDPPAPKLPTMFILHLPAEHGDDGSVTIRRDLVFRSPHDIIDGIGTLMMLNNFISLASEAYQKANAYEAPALDGSETSNLSPSYRIAAQIPETPDQAQLDRLKQMAAQKAAAASDPSVEILALPYEKGDLLPGRHQRLAFTLTRDVTQQLLKACKSVGATPTHVFHAAAAMVVRDLQDKPTQTKRVRYINYILRNERSSCQEPYSTARHPAAVYHSVSGQSLVVDMDLHPGSTGPDAQTRKKEFLSILETVKDFYLTVKQDEEFYVLAPTMFSQATPALPSGPRPLPVPEPNAHPSVSISSMGRTDAIVAPETGAFEARDPWVTGEELGNGLGLFLGTFRGELCLSAAYNDAWHIETDVKEYLERCKKVVFLGLGITEP